MGILGSGGGGSAGGSSLFPHAVNRTVRIRKIKMEAYWVFFIGELFLPSILNFFEIFLTKPQDINWKFNRMVRAEHLHLTPQAV
jgi:hypothetical protein